MSETATLTHRVHVIEMFFLEGVVDLLERQGRHGHGATLGLNARTSVIKAPPFGQHRPVAHGVGLCLGRVRQLRE